MTIEDASQRGWQKPGPKGSTQEAAFIREHLTTITLNCGVRLTVRREVAHIFKGFFDELEAETGYRLADGNADDWGYSNRPNKNNPSVLSNHAYGLAVDGNALHNPNGHRATNYPVDATHRIAKRWGLRWGEDYTGTPDPMHFEFVGTPADTASYPLGSNPPDTALSQEDPDDMAIVFATHDPSEPGQVLEVGKNAYVLDGESATSLAGGSVKTEHVSKAVLTKMLADAK